MIQIFPNEKYEYDNNLDMGYKSFNHPRWAATITEFVFDTNGKVSLLKVDAKISVTTYDADYKVASNKSIPFELPIFGTFLSGEKYNDISFGQSNEEEAHKEVIRIVKYDKNFNRIRAASIYGHAYPRSLVLHKEDSNGDQDVMDIFNISGAMWANVTRASIGGMEISKDHVLVAFNSINQNFSYYQLSNRL